MNELFKKRKFIFMNSLKIDAIVQIFVKWIWKEKKYSIIIMFDKKTQFVNHFWVRLCAKINIKSKLFIFFHSKFDNQVENVNETFKQYFKTYCNYNQNDWVNHLSIVEFETNSIKKNISRIESFLTIKSYISRFELKFSQLINEFSHERRDMRNIDAFIQKMKTLRNYLRDELKWFQIKMKKQINQNKHSISKFQVKNKIMLNVKYIKTMKSNIFLNYKN